MRSTLFTIFGLPIRSYGLMMVVGFTLGIWRATRISVKRYGIEKDRVYDIALACLLSGVIGARIVYILLNPGSENWGDFIAVWQGGLSFHGGLASAMVCGYVYTRIARLSYWQVADLVAPSVAISTLMPAAAATPQFGGPSHSLPCPIRLLDWQGVIDAPPWGGLCSPEAHSLARSRFAP